jgi:endoglycosylceramidase
MLLVTVSRGGRTYSSCSARAATVVTALLAVLAWSGSGLAGAAPHASASDGPVGPISAPGGPFLRDAEGRVVLLHGVDLMYKRAPYEIVTSGKGTNVLTNAEAASMAADGFDVVRLGIFWKGLEPGTAPMNDPAICTPGTPKAAGPGQFSAKVFDAYMARLEQTISLLARHGIYSLVDMHQDAMNEVFAGEGFPNWAVCTDGITPTSYRNVASWGVNQLDPGMAQAQGHFWHNDVVGNLQGAYDQIWAKVASRLAGNPWVIGYDPFNEPFTPTIILHTGQNTAFDAEVQCFYAGRAHPGKTQAGQPITSCPADDPATGVIPAIEHADPHHAVFDEPDTTTSGGTPNRIGSMDFPHLVYNFHDYCPLHVPNGPEPSNYAQTCPPAEEQVFTESAQDRANDASAAQPDGPAWFLSEFGATTDAADIGRIVADADAHLVGWMYWQWLRYDDPTGSHDSGLWPPGPATSAQLDVLSETYAQAIAGTPTSMGFDPSTAAFHLGYRADHAVTAPTVIYVPVSRHYPHGYCARATGGRVTSPAGATRLTVTNDRSASTVHVTVTSGTCGT